MLLTTYADLAEGYPTPIFIKRLTISTGIIQISAMRTLRFSFSSNITSLSDVSLPQSLARHLCNLSELVVTADAIMTRIRRYEIELC